MDVDIFRSISWLHCYHGHQKGTNRSYNMAHCQLSSLIFQLVAIGFRTNIYETPRKYLELLLGGFGRYCNFPSQITQTSRYRTPENGKHYIPLRLILQNRQNPSKRSGFHGKISKLIHLPRLKTKKTQNWSPLKPWHPWTNQPTNQSTWPKFSKRHGTSDPGHSGGLHHIAICSGTTGGGGWGRSTPWEVEIFVAFCFANMTVWLQFVSLLNRSKISQKQSQVDIFYGDKYSSLVSGCWKYVLVQCLTHALFQKGNTLSRVKWTIFKLLQATLTWPLFEQANTYSHCFTDCSLRKQQVFANYQSSLPAEWLTSKTSFEDGKWERPQKHEHNKGVTFWLYFL